MTKSATLALANATRFSAWSALMFTPEMAAYDAAQAGVIAAQALPADPPTGFTLGTVSIGGGDNVQAQFTVDGFVIGGECEWRKDEDNFAPIASSFYGSGAATVNDGRNRTLSLRARNIDSGGPSEWVTLELNLNDYFPPEE